MYDAVTLSRVEKPQIRLALPTAQGDHILGDSSGARRLLSLVTSAVVLTCASRVLAVPPYGQCGGQGYTGSTQCDSGTVCVKLNDWYSQCQPGAAPTSTPTSTTTVVVPPIPSTTTTTSTPTGTAVVPAPSIPAGQLTRLTANFGANPTNVGIYVYKPSNVKTNPGLLVALHGCGGSAQQFFSASQFRQQADQRGFLVIYGSAANEMNCWDITSTASLTHDGGSDSIALANAIRYALSEWGINREKVFVTGMSSGRGSLRRGRFWV
ncbi:hypothetical protein NMY22_g6760 [Coprinellus aureogranulatus]|nr:hypothetical protein NMY22_g6760 [Coprinellus aureogranulatus]